jgi:hypothetical protein
LFKFWFYKRKQVAKGSGEAFFEQQSSAMVREKGDSGSFDARLERERQN